MTNEDVAKQMWWKIRSEHVKEAPFGRWHVSWDGKRYLDLPDFINDPAQIPVMWDFLNKRHGEGCVHLASDDGHCRIRIEFEIKHDLGETGYWDDYEYFGKTINEALCMAIMEIGDELATK